MESPEFSSNPEIHILILAAGSSSRLGRPKQLIKMENQTLIRRICEVALSVEKKVTVVLGANSKLIKTEIVDLPLKILINENWQEGMASSIRMGVQNIELENLDAILVLLCDQVFVDKSLLENSIKIFTKSRPVAVCSEYENQLGVPAIFGKSLFPELLELTGEKGAKAVINQHKKEILPIPFPKGSIDLDTEEDLIKYAIK